MTLFCDAALSRRVEAAEAQSNVEFVEARATRDPGAGACWTRVEGAHALYDGPDSPVTQTFGLGLHEPATAAGLDAIEEFFRRRGAPVHHEVSPHANAAVFELLGARGYRPTEFTSVMVLPLDETASAPETAAVIVRAASAHSLEQWARTAAEGWSAEAPSLAAALPELMRVVAQRPGSRCFLAELDGQPAGAASLYVHGGVALFAGASTIPAARQRGTHRALVAARLRCAIEEGCDLAAIAAVPVGGGSQRNAERDGFQVAYTRLKWTLPLR